MDMSKKHLRQAPVAVSVREEEHALSAFCPRFQFTLELLGRRWVGAILRTLVPGPRRFNEILSAIPGLSDRLLTERLREPEMLPIGSRVRRRLVLEHASRDELCACLDHLLDAAGNPGLLSTELKATLAEHAAGNYRVMMNIGDELLAAAAERDLPTLDEKLYFDVFQPAQKPARAAAKKRPA